MKKKILIALKEFIEPTHHAIGKVIEGLSRFQISIVASRINCKNGILNIDDFDVANIRSSDDVYSILEKTDLVIIASTSSASMTLIDHAANKGIPIILCFMGGHDTSVKLMQDSFCSLLKSKIDSISKIIVSSYDAREYLIGLTTEDKIEYVPVPIWEVNISENINSENKPYILCCGRLIERKGIDTAIRALQYLPEKYHLKIFGEGHQKSALLDLSSKLSLNSRVEFMGSSELSRMLSYLIHSRALFYLSRVGPAGDVEGAPQIILWAMSMGVPVFTTSVGGIKDFVTHLKTGFIVRENTLTDIPSYLENIPILDEVTNLAKETIKKRNSIDNVIDKYSEIFNRAIDTNVNKNRIGGPNLIRAPSDCVEEILDGKYNYSLQGILFSARHCIAKVDIENYGLCCLKIRKSSIENIGVYVPDLSVYPVREVDILKNIPKNQKWAPKLIDFAHDNSWSLKTWVGGKCLDEMVNEDWNYDKVRDFWLFSCKVFRIFHGRSEPILVKDFKPKNISFDERGYYLFDFDSCDRLAEFQKNKSKLIQLGTGKYKYVAPEILMKKRNRISVASDYFSFGCCIYRFLSGRLPWTNNNKDIDISTRVYTDQYTIAKKYFHNRLRELGFQTNECDFLVECLDPDPECRPKIFTLPRKPL